MADRNNSSRVIELKNLLNTTFGMMGTDLAHPLVENNTKTKLLQDMIAMVCMDVGYIDTDSIVQLEEKRKRKHL